MILTKIGHHSPITCSKVHQQLPRSPPFILWNQQQFSFYPSSSFVPFLNFDGPISILKSEAGCPRPFSRGDGPRVTSRVSFIVDLTNEKTNSHDLCLLSYLSWEISRSLNNLQQEFNKWTFTLFSEPFWQLRNRELQPSSSCAASQSTFLSVRRWQGWSSLTFHAHCRWSPML